MFKSTGAKGAHNELLAASYLLRHGYEVFRNISPVGPIDLIAVKDNEVIKFDVKQVHRNDNDKVWLTSEQVEAGIKLIKVYEDGRVEIDLCPLVRLHELKCVCCSKIFTPNNKGTQRKYCSKACKKLVYNFNATERSTTRRRRLRMVI